MEGCNQEVHDDFYCIYTGLLSQESFQDNDFCYKTYKQRSGSITLKETCKIICNGTTGLCTWQVGSKIFSLILKSDFPNYILCDILRLLFCINTLSVA